MNLALVTLELGGIVHAAELACDSLELSQDMRDDGSATTVRCVEIAAQVLAALDLTPTAVVLVAVAARRRAKPWELDRLLNDARGALGQAAFDAAWARGQNLPLDNAVDLAAAALMRCAEAHSG